MNGKDATVKVDKNLLKKVEDFVKKNKFFYANKKQVVNLAVIEFLNRKNLNKNRKRGKKEAKNE